MSDIDALILRKRAQSWDAELEPLLAKTIAKKRASRRLHAVAQGCAASLLAATVLFGALRVAGGRTMESESPATSAPKGEPAAPLVVADAGDSVG